MDHAFEQLNPAGVDDGDCGFHRRLEAGIRRDTGRRFPSPDKQAATTGTETAKKP
jgi:hypothetical protein